MKEFLLYFEVNIICILVLAVIGFNIKNSEYSPGRRPKVMIRLIYSTIGFYILDILGEYIRADTPNPSNTIVYVLSAAYFVTYALSAYLWFFYSEILHNKAFFDDRKKRILAAIPLFTLVILLVISYFNGCLFSVTDEVGYERGPLFAVQAGISFTYILFAGVRCIYIAIGNKKASNYLDLVTFATYSFIILACGILQFAIGGIPMMVIGDTFSILLLYLHYLRNMISMDSLTQIPNRRKFMYEVMEAEKELRANETLYFMFVDVDGFKMINDRYGHLEGDRVLSEISHVMRKFCRKHNCICGRYGGDEFAVIQIINKDRIFDAPEKIYELFKKNSITVEGVPITVSVGYAEFTPGDGMNDLVSRADKSMYEVKRAKKSGGGTTILTYRKK